MPPCKGARPGLRTRGRVTIACVEFTRAVAGNLGDGCFASLPGGRQPRHTRSRMRAIAHAAFGQNIEEMTMADTRSKLDFGKAKEVAQKVMGDVGAVMHGMLSFIGDRVGLFKAMMDAGALTVDQLAARSGLNTRYVREWLSAMAAAGYVEYDAGAQTYLLTPEYAAALADEDSPFFIGSYFQMAQAAAMVAPEVAQAFRSGARVLQAQYPAGFFEAAERNSNTRYKHKLLRKWIPAMPQVVEVLQGGGTAADIGCGGGRAAIMIAQAFPKARVTGFDIHAASIERARRNAEAAGVRG